MESNLRAIKEASIGNTKGRSNATKFGKKRESLKLPSEKHVVKVVEVV